MMSSVLAMRLVYLSVHTVLGAYTTVSTLRTPVQCVQVSIIDDTVLTNKY